MNANDLLMGGAASVKFPEPGAAVTGTIIEAPRAEQQRDYSTGEPKTWPDGNPMMMVVLTLATDQHKTNPTDDPADDGARTLYLRSKALTAVREAVRRAGATGIEVGGTLTVTYTGDGTPPKPGFKGPKLFTATYRTPDNPPTGQPAEPADAPTPDRSGASTDPDRSGTSEGSAPPAGVDPKVWAGLPADQQRAVAALARSGLVNTASVTTAATDPPF